MKYRWRSYAAAFVGISLVFALGTRGVVQSLTGPGDVGLTTDSSHYSVGDTIIFSGNLDFAIGEVATTTLVLLDLSGPQTMTTGIPMLAGSHDLSNRASVPGQLQVDVTFVDIWDFGGGTKAFKGLAAGARIFIHAAWTPDQVSASSGAYRASLSADMEGATIPLTSPEAQFTIAADPTPPSGQSGAIKAATRTPTRTPRPTRTPTAIASKTPSPSPTSTSTAEPTATPTLTNSPTSSPSPLPTSTPPPPITPIAVKFNASDLLQSPTSTATPTALASPTSLPTSTPIASAIAALFTANDTATPVPTPVISVVPQSLGNDIAETGLGARAIALLVLGVAVSAGLVSVVGIPLLRR
ncbi:MAG: hypothetical protein O2821_09240 [Chloroflexi bacterium]|nr:hypothetical protein [Chloroflexota bacterium]